MLLLGSDVRKADAAGNLSSRPLLSRSLQSPFAQLWEFE